MCHTTSRITIIVNLSNCLADERSHVPDLRSAVKSDLTALSHETRKCHYTLFFKNTEAQIWPKIKIKCSVLLTDQI